MHPLARFLAMTAVTLLCSLTSAGAATVNVNCPVDSLQNAINNAAAGDIINVTGACAENLLIRNEKQRFTIDGGGVAFVNPPNPALPGFNVRGKGIAIQGFTINGGSPAIHVNRGSNAAINNNQIPSAATHGIVVDQFSFAAITNNVIGPTIAPPSPTIPGVGILISDSSSARIGFNGETDPAGPNTIRYNGVGGIAVLLSSSARIAHNTISNNQDFGIIVYTSSSALIGLRTILDTVASPNTIQANGSTGVTVDSAASAAIIGNTIKGNGEHGVEVTTNSAVKIASNEINSNGSAGVYVSEKSTVFLGEQSGSSIDSLPNTTTLVSGATLNGDAGIRCQSNGLATGRIGTLNGSLGAKHFGVNLTFTVQTSGSSDMTWGPIDEVDDANTNTANATRFTAAASGPGVSTTEVFSLNKEGCRDQLS